MRKQWARYMGQESNSEKQQPKQKRGHSTDYKLGEAAHQLNEPPKPNLQHFNIFFPSTHPMKMSHEREGG